MGFPNALYMSAGTVVDLAKGLSGIAAAVFANDPVMLIVNGGFQQSFSTGMVTGSALSENPEMAAFLARVGEHRIPCSSATLRFKNEALFSLQYTSEDGFAGRFECVSNEPNRAIQVLTALEKHFNVATYAGFLGQAISPTDRAALQLRERATQDTQTIVEKLAATQARLIEEEAEARRSLSEQLQATFAQQQKSLEERYQRRETEQDAKAQAKSVELDVRERAHAEKVKAFETRESKYVRRELLNQIKEVLASAEKLELSPGTQLKRRNVHFFSFGLMAFAAGSALYLLYKLDPATASWHVIGPLAAASATLVTTVVYYLKWNDRWFREHADAEFAAKRYKADILRASWIAELVSEVGPDGKPVQMPSQLLDAVTRNLFRDGGSSQVSEHPIDQLTGLMKRANEFTVGKNLLSVKASPSEEKT